MHRNTVWIDQTMNAAEVLKDIYWTIRTFNALSTQELHDIYKVRQQVFCVEQKCAYLDIDGQDETAEHLAAWCRFQREPIAYARVLRPESINALPAIGRVLTISSLRRHGLGRAVLQRAVAHAQALWPGRGLQLSAQSRLVRFYESEGFKAMGNDYLEDGLLHTLMVRTR